MKTKTKGRILEAIRAAGVPTHRDLRHEHESLRVKEIAETVGVGPATVRKWATELADEGLIEIEMEDRWGLSFLVYRAVACRSCDGRGIGCDACDGEGAALAEPDGQAVEEGGAR